MLSDTAVLSSADSVIECVVGRVSRWTTLVLMYLGKYLANALIPPVPSHPARPTPSRLFHATPSRASSYLKSRTCGFTDPDGNIHDTAVSPQHH